MCGWNYRIDEIHVGSCSRGIENHWTSFVSVWYLSKLFQFINPKYSAPFLKFPLYIHHDSRLQSPEVTRIDRKPLVISAPSSSMGKVMSCTRVGTDKPIFIKPSCTCAAVQPQPSGCFCQIKSDQWDPTEVLRWFQMSESVGITIFFQATFSPASPKAWSS